MNIYLLTVHHLPKAVIIAPDRTKAIALFNDKWGLDGYDPKELRLNEIRLTEKDIPRILLDC